MEKLSEQQVTDLRRLQDQLRARQREALLSAAKGAGHPPRRLIQEIAELESAIVAVDAVVQEGT